jgi:hypothetical protein
MRCAFALLALLPALAQAAPVTLVWDIHPSHDDPAIVWEVEHNAQVSPCGPATLTVTDRRCTLDLPVGETSLRLRAELGEQTSDWSEMIVAQIGEGPGEFVITWHGESEADPVTFAVTQRASVSNGTNSGQTYSGISFTPTANSRVFVFAVAQCDDHNNGYAWSISGSTGWTQLDVSGSFDWDGFSSFDGQVIGWWKDVGASPSAESLTIDPNSGSTNTYFISVGAFDVTGFDSGTPFAQASVDNGATEGGTGDSSGHNATLTLGANPTNGNLVVGVYGAGADSGGGFSIPTGYTALINQNQAYTQLGVFYRTDTTSPSIVCSDVGNDVGNWGGIAFEMNLGGGAPAASLPPRRNPMAHMLMR